MSTEVALQQAEELLATYAKGTAKPEANRLDVTIEGSDLTAAATALQKAHWGYLSALTGVDLGPEEGAIEALYHFCEGAATTTFRVRLPRSGGVVPSLHTLYPNAMFYERELLEMFGVTVTGLADTSHLFLPDGWPDGTYPLLKDVDAQAAAERMSGSEPPEMGRQGDKFIVPIGPQHPALKEPGHFEFGVDGELVTSAKVRLGYVHRGIERATQERNYVQNLYLVERVCGICSHSHGNAYALAVEKLAGVQVTPRAQAIREMVACLERIHSHLLWLGVAAHEAGFETLFMYSWRDREVVMDLLERWTGNRVNYSANVLGGVKFDVSPEIAAEIRKGMDTIDERTRHYLHVTMDDTSFLQRSRGIGTMSQAEADQPWGRRARGPGLRGPAGRPNRCPVRGVCAVSGQDRGGCGRGPGRALQGADGGDLREQPRHPRHPGWTPRRGADRQDAAADSRRRSHHSIRGPARRAALLRQEQRHGHAGASQDPDPQHLQLDLGDRQGRRVATGRRAAAARRHRSVLFV